MGIRKFMHAEPNQGAGLTTSNGPTAGIRITLEPLDSTFEAVSGCVIGIHGGQIHIISDWAVVPGIRALVRFERIAVAGHVDYCLPKNSQFRTSFVIEDGRSAARFPVDQHGVLTVLDGQPPGSHKCRLTDISRSGVGLDSPVAVNPGCMICVQTDRMLVVGEVRHWHPNQSTGFRLGIAVTDVVRNSIPASRLKRLRRYVAEVILGEPIGSA